MTTRAEWLEKRKSSIGGSEASAVIGMNPYMSNVELWELKTGRREPEDISEKDYVKYGTEAEKHLTELFKLDYPEYEVSTEEYGHIVHPEYDFIGGSLDGHLVEKETGRKGVLEIKTTNILQSMQREKWNQQIPQNYYIQCLHYLLVTNYEFAILKAQLKTVWEGKEVLLTTKHYKIERSEKLEDIKFLKQKEIEFWQENVKKDIPPNLILPAI